MDGAFPNADETTPTDGWAVLRASARAVQQGTSAHGQPAGEGSDGATGYGLVDALAAYRLARSIVPRRVQTVPPPR